MELQLLQVSTEEVQVCIVLLKYRTIILITIICQTRSIYVTNPTVTTCIML